MAVWLVTCAVDVTVKIIAIVLRIVKIEGRIVYVSLFWFLICVANVNHSKPAHLLLGGHQEVHTVKD